MQLVTKFGIVRKGSMEMAAVQKSAQFFASPHICDDGFGIIYRSDDNN